MGAGEVLIIAFGAVVAAVIAVQLVSRSRKRTPRRRVPTRRPQAGQTVMHLPSDDPHWRTHAERQAARKAKRRRAWAAGGAGALGAAIDGPGACGGGGCGGGGCGGGGCGGGGG